MSLVYWTSPIIFIILAQNLLIVLGFGVKHFRREKGRHN